MSPAWRALNLALSDEKLELTTSESRCGGPSQ